jgi:hypothetical protein
MENITYKKWHIDNVYDCSEGYDEIKYFAVWTPDRSDVVAEEFITIEHAKMFIDYQVKKNMEVA